MALEIYVMPLQRYLQGDYEAISRDQEGPSQELSDAETARERVATLQRDLSEATGSEVSWSDEGEVIMRRSIDSRHLHALRSFAAHLEYPPKILFFLEERFRVLDDPRDHKGLRKIYDGQPTTFEHLMRHSDDRGFYFPVAFSSPATSSESKWWMIGSSHRLKEELQRISGRFDESTPLLVKDTCASLLDIAEASIHHRLPIVWQQR